MSVKEIDYKIKLSILGKISNPKLKNEGIEDIVQYVLENYHVYTIREDRRDLEVWIYENGIYVPNGKTYIKEIVRMFLGDSYNDHISKNVLSRIEIETYIDMETFFKVKDVYDIPVKNGIYNVKEDTLRPFDPKCIFFSKINAKYLKEADCPKIKEFIGSIVCDDSDCLLIQELSGYFLLRDYRFPKAFMFEGSGRNGKSQLLNLFSNFIGVRNISNLSLEDIEDGGFKLSTLHHKMANICGDLPKTALKKTENFKKLTGGDEIDAQRKFLNSIKLRNHAKMVFSTNELPIIYDTSKASMYRWIGLTFPRTFLPVDDIPKDNKDDNIRVAKPNIIQDIMTDDEMDGFFNFAIEGLKRILKNSGFTLNRSSEENYMVWTRKANFILAFADEYLQDGKIVECIPKSILKRMYFVYCKKHSIRALSDKFIKNTLEENFAVDESQKRLNSGGSSRFWVGLGFKEKAFEDFENLREDLKEFEFNEDW